MSKINVINEIQQNFLDSSWETNCNRAFPDIRDGLKPGQRACLWEMYIKKYTSNKPHVKSAKVSGGVIADLWPHGDQAIYETFARMSQPFTNNIPEVEWHGANGNPILGGDALADQRYTECRLSPIVEEGMLKTVNKNAVDMIPNFSEDMEWPKVFPSIFPRLLVNGAQGIGVGVSNTWLPHNFSETVDLIMNYLKTQEVDNDNYYPDFPTGGIIVNKEDLAQINKTGKGKAIIEAKYEIKGQYINFYEFPYQVFIEPLIDEIKAGIESEKIAGVADVTNRSDKKRLSLVVQCENDYEPEKVVNILFNETNLRKQFNANQNGIVSKTPIMVNLKKYLEIYTEHNLNCIYREFEYEKKKALDRYDIVCGLIFAIQHIDEIIDAIKRDIPLQSIFPELKDSQVKAILDMKISKLSKLETEKLENEKEKLYNYIKYCEEILDTEQKRIDLLIERLQDLYKKFKDTRRTEVMQKEIVKTKGNSKSKNKTVIPEDVMVILTKNGYLKSVSIKQYRSLPNSEINNIKTQTTDYILLFSSLGKCYRLKVDSIKQCNNKDKGIAAGAILNLENNEKIVQIFSMNINEKHPYIVGFTRNGLVKKSEKTIFIGTTQNKNGFKAAGLNDNDEYIYWHECNGDYALLHTLYGYYIQFKLDDVSPVGKTAKGVIGIKLNEKDYVTDVSVLRIPSHIINVQKRAGKGKKV